MQCKSCGNHIKEGSLFCSNCGTKVDIHDIADTAADAIKDKVEDISSEIKDAAGKAAEEVKEIPNQVSEIAKDVTEEIKDAAGKAAEGVEEIPNQVSEIAKDVTEEIKDVAGKATEEVEEIPNQVSEIAKDVTEEIKDVAGKATEEIEEIPNQVSEIAKDVTEEIKDVVGETTEEVKEIPNQASEIAKDVTEEIKDVAGKATDEVKEIPNQVSEIAKDVTEEIKDVAGKATDEVKNIPEQLAHMGADIKDEVLNKAEAAKSSISAMLSDDNKEKIKESVEDISDKAKEVAKATKENVKEVAKKASEMSAVAAQGAKDTTEKLVDKFKDAKADTINFVNEKSGGDSKKKKAVFGIIIGVIAIAALIILALIFFVLPKFFGGKKSAAKDMLYYVKDNVLYRVNPNTKKAKPEEYTDDFIQSISGGDITDIAPYFNSSSFTSSDGKYSFVVEDVEYSYSEGISYSLYYKKGNKDKKKMDTNISDHYITKDNKVVYMKKSNLYVSDLKEKKKVGSDVYFFRLDDKEKNILWSEGAGLNDTDAYDLRYNYYVQDINMKKEAKRLEKEATIVAINDDFSKILFYKDENLYLSTNLKDTNKILSGVYDVEDVNLKDNTFYYTKERSSKKALIDFVEDDLANADAKITEPNKKDYEKEEMVDYGFFKLPKTTVDDKYYEELKKFEDKKRRDELRQELKEETVDIVEKDLYFYDGKDSTLINNRFIAINKIPYRLNDNEDVRSYIVYSVFNKENDDNRMKMSEVEYKDEVEAFAYSDMGAEISYHLYIDNKDFPIEIDDDEMILRLYHEEGNKIYFLSGDAEYRNGGKLSSISLDKKNLGKIEFVDENVDEILTGDDINIYYTKNENNKSFGNVLYKNGKEIADDIFSADTLGSSDTVILTTNYNSDDFTTDIAIYKNGKIKELGSDVYSGYNTYNDKSIAFLEDYNTKTGKGDLKYYNGKEIYTIDTDVQMILFR